MQTKIEITYNDRAPKDKKIIEHVLNAIINRCDIKAIKYAINPVTEEQKQKPVLIILKKSRAKRK